MEVENRIETFGGQVDDLPDELRDRRRISGGSGDNGVILEEDEDSRDGDIEKSPVDGTTSAVAGRVIKKPKRPLKACSFSEPGAPIGPSAQLNIRSSKNLRRSRNAMGRGLPKKGGAGG